MRSLLIDVLHRRARPLALACAASAGHQICEALVPLAIGLAVGQAVDGGPPAAILLAVLAMLALFAVLATGGGAMFWQVTSAAAKETHQLRVRTAGRILADPRAGAGRRAGDLANVLVSDTKATAEIIRAVVNVVSGCAGLLVTVVVLLRVDPWLGLGIALGALALTLAIERVSPWLERRIAARQHTAGLAAALAAELVHGLRPLRGFGGVPAAVHRYRRASRESLAAALRGATASATVEGAGLVATGLVLLGTTAAAGAMATSGRIGVGDFVTVVAMASFVGDPVQRVAAGIKQAAISRASASRVEALLDLGAPASSVAPTMPLGPLRLRTAGLDITAHPGEMLGIVTTDPATADALIAVFTTGTGIDDSAVSLGDIPVAALDRHTRVRHVLTEPHAVHLFGRTLSEALDTGRGTDTATIERALAAARAAEVSSALLDGGGNLSGGQRQRVALARALAARAPVLVLRDPLTAVDAVTEDAVADGLAALRRDEAGATVAVSTSPPLLARCDRVLFLADSHPPVVATHAELAEDAEYAKAVLR